MHKRKAEELRDSEVGWIGNIPTHWSLIKFKYSVRLVNQKSEYSSFTVALENLESWTGRYLESDSDYNPSGISFKKGDVLFGKLRPYLAKGYLAKKPGNAIGDFYVFRGRKYLPEFLLKMVLSEAFIDIVDSSTYGAKMPRASWDFIGELELPVPSIEEQKAIATFLDRKTQAIDQLIEKKQQLIEKLKEKRQALITQAVTKGLNPDVPMQDSGIEWLGEIPAHWNATKLKWLVSKIGSGKTPRGGFEIYKETGIPFLRSQNIQFEGLYLDDVVYISEEIHKDMSSTAIKPNDVLLNITGASIGRTSFIPDDFPKANLNQHVCIIRPKRSVVSTKFLHLLLSSDLIQNQIFAYENGTSREGLNFAQVGSLIVSLPPIQEQMDIISKVDDYKKGAFSLIEKVNHEINQLTEYRQSLISAAVTGKIDVRDEIHELAK